MPNFNGALILHSLQLLQTPATLREIIVNISKNTDLPQEDLIKPVKQTLDMGHRLGFLQKLNGRYFLVPITFESLMSEMKALNARTNDGLEKPELKQKIDKRTQKKQTKQMEPSKKTVLQKPIRSNIDQESTTTLVAPPSKVVMLRKPKRSQMATKQ